tara:strand:+ start:360 stop:521 length:162 start_codon:yes stop_codon:yes gene_type:complete
MEQERKVERIMERIRKLEVASHPPVDWDRKIDELAKKVKKLEQLINKGDSDAK